MGVNLTPSEILAIVPQQQPFRFIDEILAVDELGITGTVRFDPDMVFYKGHFPGKPVTPGVILLEAMCQVGIVAHGIFLFALEESIEDAKRWTTFFADAETEFFKPVLPGEKLVIKAERIFWRRRKLRSKITMTREDGTLVAQATASGVGVRNEEVHNEE